MFTNISMTGAGIIMYFLALVLNHFGLNYDTGSLQGVADAFMIILSFAWVIIGQLRRKDLFMGIWRK